MMTNLFLMLTNYVLNVNYGVCLLSQFVCVGMNLKDSIDY